MTTYAFDFLETITAISFPTGGTVLVRVDAVSRNPTTPVVPTCPSVKFTLGAGETLLDKVETFKKVVVPNRTFLQKFFFIWDNVAPFPTADNFNKQVWNIPGSSIPNIIYAGQFSQFVLINSAQFAPPSFPGQNTNGFYASLAEASAAAAALRTRYFLGHPAGSTQGYATSAGTLIGGLDGPPLQDPFGAELDVSIPLPGSGSCTLTGFYLIKVPAKKTKFTVAVTQVPNGGSIGGLRASGYHGSKPSTVAQAQATQPDTTDGPVQTPTSTVTSVIDSLPAGKKNTVTVTGIIPPPPPHF